MKSEGMSAAFASRVIASYRARRSADRDALLAARCRSPTWPHSRCSRSSWRRTATKASGRCSCARCGSAADARARWSSTIGRRTRSATWTCKPGQALANLAAAALTTADLYERATGATRGGGIRPAAGHVPRRTPPPILVALARLRADRSPPWRNSPFRRLRTGARSTSSIERRTIAAARRRACRSGEGRRRAHAANSGIPQIRTRAAASTTSSGPASRR